MGRKSTAEDFIGQTFNDGKLKVIGIYGKTKNGETIFKVTCEVCSQDPELFPNGYFVSLKSSLLRGSKPCGCSFNPKWKNWQYLILARRSAEGRFIVHGFSEEFHGANTKVLCECIVDGNKWTASINNIVNSRSGCPECMANYIGNNNRTPENIAIEKCVAICKEMNYKPIGFPDGYKNRYSRFEYECPVHGIQNIEYNSFSCQGCRCAGCYKDTRKELYPGFYGWYPERAEEQDYLYVMNFNDQYIKVGRSFNVKTRNTRLKSESKIKNIKVLSVYAAKHGVIYPTEQEIHAELRERNFDYYPETWSSTECFQNDSLYVVEKLLGQSGLEKVEDHKKVKYNAKD